MQYVQQKRAVMRMSLGRWGLTTRSTGPIAAGRHLGYKSLAQMPTRRNGPVSSNVSHQSRKAVATRNSALTPSLRKQMNVASANTKHKASTHQQWALPAGRSSQVGRWSALRASVLRRAASLSGTAQERRAEISAVVVSPGSRGASPKWKSNVPTIVRSAN